MKLGVLDYCFEAPGQSAADRLAEAIELAQIVDHLGFTRFWVAEHHGGNGAAHATPEIMIASIAARTRRIVVGSAGILLRYASPYKLTECFRCLEALYPGRVDLGLAAGSPSPHIIPALLDGAPPPTEASFDRKAHDLVGFLRNTLPEGHPYQRARASPEGVDPPRVWVFGSSPARAALAASMGACLGVGLFLPQTSEEGGLRAVEEYCRKFRARPKSGEATWNLTVAGVCAVTRQDVERISAQHQNPFIKINVAGTPGEVKERLLELARAYKTDEVIFAQLGNDFRDRVKAYQLLAEAFGMDRSNEPVRTACEGEAC